MNYDKELYRAEQLPIFQNRMYRTQTEGKACPKGDVILVQDMDTGLIFNRAFRPDLVQYDADYQNEQAVSSIFKAHLENVSKIIHNNFQNYRLIEVGCGKGFFLEYLQKLGFDVFGIDPAYEGKNPYIIKKHFTLDLGLQADGIILRHVLEHVQNPFEFLDNIRKVNNGIGKIYIEVPCLDWICSHHAWFDIFYEHVNYFRINDLIRFFGTSYEYGHLFGGQYFYIVADLSTLQKPIYDDRSHFEFPKNFLASVDRHTNRLNDKTKTKSVIWGGASKGVIFAIFMERAGINFDFVIDINSAKQGKYLPGTGMRVHSPEDVISRLDTFTDIFVMNSNYLDEIRTLTNNRFSYITVEYEKI
ncbi:MAG: methyltransferase domain-containing protein [Proteobacteria bacterium]|nr:methyltransferase domain-containing protein [Desulfobacula sp.]MBU3952647.1 methyltransferase domain-containing protein [Pseudomonadota bacterium]MBU4133597.1 methyltransferase domain-containing protein [Pseudomonadota bacterium]